MSLGIEIHKPKHIKPPCRCIQGRAQERGKKIDKHTCREDDKEYVGKTPRVALMGEGGLQGDMKIEK